MAKVLTKIINAICVLIIAASLVLIGSVVLSRGESYPSIMGFSIFRVMSQSMEPAIKTDSMILVKKVDPSTIQTGDIITFVSSDPTIDGYANTHRVMSIDTAASGSPVFTTKGDNNVIADKYKVTADKLIGKVIFISYFIGLFIRLMSNPLCFGAVIIIPLAIIFALNIRDLFKVAKAYEEAELKDELKTVIEEKKRKQAEAKAEAEAEAETEIQQSAEPEAPKNIEVSDATLIEDLFVSDVEAALAENVSDAVAIDFGDEEPAEQPAPEAPVFQGRTVEEVLRERAGGVQDASVILFKD
ncbi:MAG: signal peptidase I [Clostridia bacterium]|nr:signal peptidase I [Clostridia bacterium]